MAERIKDFLYDVSDIFFSLLIIAGIFLVVTWKISTSMSFELLPTYFQSTDDSQKVLQEVKIIKNTSPTTKVPDAKPDDDSKITITDETNTGTSGEDNTTTPDGTTSNTTTDSGSDTSSSTVNVIEDIEIVVAPGSSGHSIAKQLESKGLIDQVSDFNIKVEEMGLGGKLQQGTFTLSSDDTLENMIRVLCRRDRQ